MRDFSRTAEPRGGVHKARATAAAPKLAYVVQRHDARRLHYDFRLELDGALLSWAVPKGPSLDPHDKRLAVETEPHPLEYGEFEGQIPEGEYGAGKVMIWDRGSWEPEGDPQKDYARGRLSFKLHGQKLHGVWHLVRTANDAGKGGKSNWLLMKSRDEFARDGDGKPEDTPARRAKPAPATKPHARARGPKKRLEIVEPELATLVSAAPEGDAWVHELKFDGYRLLARIEGGKVTLSTRNGNDWTERMPELAAALSELDVLAALLDGEVVVLDERGVSDFQRLQNSLSEEGGAALVYYAFDLLHLDGADLRSSPLTERKRALTELVQAAPAALRKTLRLSEHVVGQGPAFFAQACKLGVEGIVSKRADSTYRSGRGRDWLKTKCTKRQEFAVVGYTDPGGSRAHFGALLLAVKGDKGFVYSGRVGTGFTEASLAELKRALDPLGVAKLALENAPRGAQARGVHWVKPQLVAEIAFAGFTTDGLLRHPTFHGLREDKPVAEVRAERPQDEPKRARAATDYPLTHPDKVLYPEQGITKREILEYYALVAERMLPHVRNRPLTLVRCPNGYDKPGFFQKHPGKSVPPGVRSVPIREGEGKAPYSVIDAAEGLFGLVQLGALEIHTWGSRASDYEHPDLVVFDLDPDPALAFGEVIRCAQELRSVFEGAKLESFVKSTGGKGLHVCLPIAPELTWEEVKDFSRRIAEAFVAREPKRYVATATKSRRQGKIFIDYLRNARSATFVAPYSTRAREGAPIAVPLAWEELTSALKPDQFNVRNVRARLEAQEHDPFERMAGLAQSLRGLLARVVAE